MSEEFVSAVIVPFTGVRRERLVEKTPAPLLEDADPPELQVFIEAVRAVTVPIGETDDEAGPCV